MTQLCSSLPIEAIGRYSDILNMKKLFTNSKTLFGQLDHKGFSLPGLMVSAAVMSVLSLGIASIINNMQNSVSFIEDKQSMNDLKTMITMDLSANTSCQRTFAGMSVPGVQANLSIPSLRNHLNAVTYSSGQEYDRLNISNFNLINETVSLPSLSGRMTLEVNVQRARQSSVAMKPIRIPINVQIGPDSRIVNCAVEGSNGLASGNGEGARCEQNPPSAFAGRSATHRPPHSEGTVLTVNSTRSTGVNTYSGTVTYLCINSRWAAISENMSERGPAGDGGGF